MSNVAFRPVRGTEQAISRMEKSEGCLYFATDSGKIYMDTDIERVLMGSASGAAIFYGKAADLKQDETSEYYNILKTDVLDGTPKSGDLILNSDGGFYKVEKISNEYYICTLLSISGTNGGGGSIIVENRPTITKLNLDSYSLINGSEAYFDLEAESAFIDGTPIDDVLRVSISLGTKQNVNDDKINSYWTTTLIYRTNTKEYFENYGVGPGYIKDRIEFGSKLRPSTTSYLVVQVLQGNHDAPSKVRGLYDPITTSILELKQLSSYTPATRYATGGFNLQYNVNGAIDKKIEFFFDGIPMKPNGNGDKTDFSSYT
jgi:hypothetical protein